MQEEERRLVAGVEVVEDEHERPYLRGSLQERRDGVEEAEASALRLRRVRLGQAGKQVAKLGYELGDLRSAAA